MSNICNFCGKRGRNAGNNVSHSHRKTKRTFQANITRKKLPDLETGKIRFQKICTACLRTRAKPDRLAERKLAETA